MSDAQDNTQNTSDTKTLLTVLLLAWGLALYTAVIAVYLEQSMLSNPLFLWMAVSVLAGFISSIFLFLNKKWAGWLCLAALASASVHAISTWFVGGMGEIDWWSVIAVFGAFAIVQTHWSALK